MNRGLAHYTSLDPRRPWPGIERDPAVVARALESMSRGGIVHTLGASLARPHHNDSATDGVLASVVKLAPALITTLGPTRCFEAAAGLVHAGGLVVIEEPDLPQRVDPEPVLVSDDRVVIWSAEGGDVHDIRIVEFTATSKVEAATLATVDGQQMDTHARRSDLEPVGAWGDWAFTEQIGHWRVSAYRMMA